MRDFKAETQSRRARSTKPSEELRIAVTFRRKQDDFGPTKFTAPLNAVSVRALEPDPLAVARGLDALAKHGFRVTTQGPLSASVRGTRAQFEKAFGTQLTAHSLPAAQNASQHSFYFPAPGAPWSPDLAVASLIDDAYIQWPHIYMAAPVVRANPPAIPFFHLQVPGEVSSMLNATAVHHAGTTGKGVRVAMLDSGFYHEHPYFTSRGYRSSQVLAPGANRRGKDKNGHGTGESANIFALAPDVDFVGVKLDNDDNPDLGASVLEGLQEALRHRPHVISVSLGYDLRELDALGRPTLRQLAELPNSLAALEAEIAAAVANGVVVVFSAGNGHYSFPGMHPDVISAGGAYLDENAETRASDYASAFPSKIYHGRNVPDFCGLVGLQPHADYIALPIPPGSEIDVDNADHDGTAPNDGWGVFSGTSAAAPQLAGVCALLLEKNPGLTPSDVKAVLLRAAVDVSAGSAHPSSDEQRGEGVRAGAGLDGATGGGLVDAFAAWQLV
ncbi:MAG: S8 family serine peptidase [Deltaproteobacteria bacterium]